MGERTALIAGYVAMLSAVGIAWFGLAWIGAKDGVFVTVILVIACIGSLALSGIVLHYTPPDERER